MSNDSAEENLPIIQGFILDLDLDLNLDRCKIEWNSIYLHQNSRYFSNFSILVEELFENIPFTCRYFAVALATSLSVEKSHR